MFTKLAWMNGLEIEIDNPLVPMELMPVKPLDYYNYALYTTNFIGPLSYQAFSFLKLLALS